MKNKFTNVTSLVTSCLVRLRRYNFWNQTDLRFFCATYAEFLVGSLTLSFHSQKDSSKFNNVFNIPLFGAYHESGAVIYL